MVKFLDLKSQYYSIKSEIDKAIQNVIENSTFIGGEHVAQFETNFSNYVGTDYCIGVGNGTDALEISIEALDMPIGSEIIVPANSFIASSEAVTRSGHKVVFVDIDTESYVISIEDLKKRITPKTKAIMAVHLYGHPCDMDELAKIAKEYNLYIIEDCAQAHGAMFNNQKVGSFGDVGCFSFFGNKVITTGEGGMCTTNDPLLNKKINILRDHGMSVEKRYWHDIVGFNYRITNLQAAIGVAQLERIECIHKNRKEYEDFYREVFSEKNYTFQSDLSDRRRITWLVSFLVDKDTNREEYISNLKEKGIDARPFFYLLSDMDIYKKYCHKSTPVAKKISTLGLNLPTYESLKSIAEIETILNGV